jgi:hypothetical protein
MNAKVIQGLFVGGRPRAPALLAQHKGAPRRSGPPAPAFAGSASLVQARGPGDSFQVNPIQLGLLSGGGRALPDAVRGKMEAALGADFSNVRIHMGPQAERIGAVAFTMGNDIYFAPGRFQPDTAQGQQLLGHELAHVVQQRAGRVRNPMGAGVAVVQDRTLEAEADRLGHLAAARRHPEPPAQARLHATIRRPATRTAQALIQRQSVRVTTEDRTTNLGVADPLILGVDTTNHARPSIANQTETQIKRNQGRGPHVGDTIRHVIPWTFLEAAVKKGVTGKTWTQAMAWLVNTRRRHPRMTQLYSPVLDNNAAHTRSLQTLEYAIEQWLFEAQNDPRNLFYGPYVAGIGFDDPQPYLGNGGDITQFYANNDYQQTGAYVQMI